MVEGVFSRNLAQHGGARGQVSFVFAVSAPSTHRQLLSIVSTVSAGACGTSLPSGWLPTFCPPLQILLIAVAAQPPGYPGAARIGFRVCCAATSLPGTIPATSQLLGDGRHLWHPLAISLLGSCVLDAALTARRPAACRVLLAGCVDVGRAPPCGCAMSTMQEAMEQHGSSSSQSSLELDILHLSQRWEAQRTIRNGDTPGQALRKGGAPQPALPLGCGYRW